MSCGILVIRKNLKSMIQPNKAPVAPHVIAWRTNIQEVDRLLSIHTLVAGTSPGRKRDVQVLNKSALILLLACWEAYVEDMAKNSFEFMLDNAAAPNVFEEYVLAIAAKEIKQGSTQDLWALAGSGWKTALSAHKEKILNKYIVKGSFNTPSSENIDRLFSELIGLKGMSKEWHWPGMSNATAITKLAELIDQRGAIAHRVESSQAVYKKDVVAYRNFISRLAVITHNRMLALVYAKTKKRPWRRHKHGKTN